MEPFDIGYFDPTVQRRIPDRTLSQRIIAWGLDAAYYDGDRRNGYGGFAYDGRWRRLIPRLAARYGLDARSRVLDIGCKKGFFLHDLKEAFPGITAKGVENHPYPLETGLESVRADMMLSPYHSLPFDDDSFDFVLAFSAIYMQTLGDVLKTLREIQRVGRGRAYVTVGAYSTMREREQFERWTLLGTTVLHVDEWMEVFQAAGYTGDYFFTTPGALNLID
jgi:SAM-dependent methyltransferase